MTWRFARQTQGKRGVVPAETCGMCRERIPIGAKVLDITIGVAHRVRCQACGEHMLGETAPEVIEVTPIVPEPPGFELVGDVARRSQ